MRARGSQTSWGVMACAASLVLAACKYPDLPPVGATPDGPPGSGSDGPHVTLDWQIALPSSVVPAPVFKPISPAPRVRIAPLRTSLDTNIAPPAFVDATYHADGTIQIPDDYLTQAWRLEYTLSDGIPREVQWRPDDRRGHITVPLFGRSDRAPAPASGGYSITPSNPPASYTSPVVFTTGLWTSGEVPVAPAGAVIDYNFAESVSLSGPIGAPDAALGDRGLVIDFNLQKNCRTAIGAAEFDPTIRNGELTSSSPAWEVNLESVSGIGIDTDFLVRLSQKLGNLSTPIDTSTSSFLFGVIPSMQMPALAGSADALRTYALVLPSPVMIALLRCPLSAVQTSVAVPVSLAAFPHILHAQVIESRQALGVSLPSGMETVLVGEASFSVSFPAPIPTQLALTTPLGKLALDGPTEQVEVGSPHGTFTLSFTPESGSDLRADYYDIVLHRIVNNTLTTERIYTVTAPSVQLDAALLAPLTDYVFEIRSIKGHPQAAIGDFALVEYPYGSAVVFPRTIKTGPAQ